MARAKREIKAGLTTKSSAADVNAVQDYLKRFGYLGEAGEGDFGAPPFPLGEGDQPGDVLGRVTGAKKGKLDAATKAAIERFQAFAHLPRTGVVDEATAAKMNMPRCANLDGPVAEFSTSGRKWATNNLRYAFENFTGDLTDGEVILALEQAFALWAAYTPLRFTRVATSVGPEIVIRFVPADHGDGFPFDGPGSVLAHAFFPSIPPAAPTAIMGDAHFDEDETWTVAVPPGAGGIDLVTVAAHEFGHSLGLGHSSVSGALMAPFYGGPFRKLADDDIAGITSLYGGFPIEQAAWAHGTDLQIEHDNAVASMRRYGFFTRVVGKANT
ncbi:MAG TPA: matrixin family metalloprotease, partial [Candidatus Limnocylindrales bacterium]